QVVNLSVDYKERLMTLVYTLSQEGKPVPAQVAVDAMVSVNETDMSRLLGYQVVTKAEHEPVPCEAPEGLYDRVPPIPAHETDGPQPLPRKSLRPETAALDSGSDSDTSLRSTPSTASTGRAKGITSSPDSVTTSLISDEGSNPAASGNSGKTSTDEEIREAQKQLDCMKKRIGEILDDALAKAAPKKVYGRMATPAETPVKHDAPTQTPAESKPRVIWSICKTSEVAAQTSLSVSEPEFRLTF
ncbi:unnamed protein product, partial [Ixodes pacificus]